MAASMYCAAPAHAGQQLVEPHGRLLLLVRVLVGLPLLQVLLVQLLQLRLELVVQLWGRRGGFVMPHPPAGLAKAEPC